MAKQPKSTVHVKMYQLFLTTETYPPFVERLLFLREKYGVFSGTDTVARALAEQAAKEERSLTGTEIVVEAVRRESDEAGFVPRPQEVAAEAPPEPDAVPVEETNDAAASAAMGAANAQDEATKPAETPETMPL